MIRKITKKTLLFFIPIIIISACNNSEEERKAKNDTSSVEAETQKEVKQFITNKMQGEQNFLITFDDGLYSYFNHAGLTNTYSIVWPAEGMLTPEAEKELMNIYFGKTKATNVDEALKKWVNTPDFYEGEEGVGKIEKVKKINDTITEKSSFYMESICEQDSNLATFTITNDMYMAGAAHGMYNVSFVVIDVAQGTIIHLTDIIDTTGVEKMLIRAVKEITENKGLTDCLYDELLTAKHIPMTTNFTIDKKREKIILQYQVYEIAPYVCGMQEITLPVQWLRKYITFTPYGVELFGLAHETATQAIAKKD